MPDWLWSPAVILLAWGFFGFVHSILCRSGIKRYAERIWGPPFLAGLYRPLYSIISIAMVVWLWGLSAGLPGDITFLILPGPYINFVYAAKTAAVLLVAVCFREFSFMEFTGISQLLRWLRGELKSLPGTPAEQTPMAHRDGPLSVGGIFAWVRHPLNTAAIMWIWFQPAYTLHNTFFAVCLTTYILIGNRYEERDLVARYGPAYERYAEVVPAFFGGVSDIHRRKEKLRPRGHEHS
jgi:hypothetical protein